MKKCVMFIALFCLCSGVLVQAQTKSGHINFEEVVNLMPQRDSAYTNLQLFIGTLEETYVGIQNEYQMKATEYQQRQATWTASILETKQRELSQIMERLEQFQQSAQQEMGQMQNMLLTPVYNKAREAIEKVGKELGLVYVFDSSGMLYIDENQSINLLDKVKAELKIPAEKVAPTPLGN